MQVKIVEEIDQEGGREGYNIPDSVKREIKLLALIR